MSSVEQTSLNQVNRSRLTSAGAAPVCTDVSNVVTSVSLKVSVNADAASRAMTSAFSIRDAASLRRLPSSLTHDASGVMGHKPTSP